MLDIIAYWTDIEGIKVEPIFDDPEIIQKLIDSFKQSDRQNFQEIIPSYSKLIVNSPNLTKHLS